MEPISLEMDMWTSSPITSRHSRAAASSWSLRTVENTQEMATERTLPSSPSKKARAASWSKGANSLPSYSKPPPTMTLSTAIFFRSSAQSTMGGMPTVAGAPMRMTPMGARFLRSTMALVHWVVPSMAWPMALGSTPDWRMTPRMASTMPSYTSEVVWRLTSATTLKFSSISTASVLVPPTSMPSLYISPSLPCSAPPGECSRCRSRNSGGPPGRCPRDCATGGST